MILLIFAVTYTALAAIAMSMTKHYKALWQKKPTHWHRFLLQVFGWVALGTSFWMCLVSWEQSIGAAAWFGMFTIAGFLFTIVFSYAPFRAYQLVPVLPILGAISFSF